MAPCIESLQLFLLTGFNSIQKGVVYRDSCKISTALTVERPAFTCRPCKVMAAILRAKARRTKCGFIPRANPSLVEVLERPSGSRRSRGCLLGSRSRHCYAIKFSSVDSTGRG